MPAFGGRLGDEEVQCMYVCVCVCVRACARARARVRSVYVRVGVAVDFPITCSIGVSPQIADVAAYVIDQSTKWD